MMHRDIPRIVKEIGIIEMVMQTMMKIVQAGEEAMMIEIAITANVEHIADALEQKNER